MSDIPHLASRLNLAPVAKAIEGQIKGVEDDIRAQTAVFDPALVGYAQYVFDNRGKGIRAALCLLSGGIYGAVSEQHVRAATILELIHLASLVHDDILDNADLRRGMPTVRAKWGPEVAVLLGDCLFAHAMTLCSGFETTSVARAVSEAANGVCQGEILQTQKQFDLGMSIPEYRKIISMKTAALFSVACRLGAQISGAPSDQVENISLHGEKLGVAYQMYDDLLDFVGIENSTGKTLGTDLGKGKFTLPVLIYMARAKDAAAEKARAVLLHGDEAGRIAFIQELHIGGAFSASVEMVRAELTEAAALIEGMPKNSYSQAIGQMSALLARHLEEFLCPSQE